MKISQEPPIMDKAEEEEENEELVVAKVPLEPILEQSQQSLYDNLRSQDKLDLQMKEKS